MSFGNDETSEFADLCKFGRSNDLGELYNRRDIVDIIKLFSIQCVLLFGSICVYSVPRAFGEKYRQLGHNVMRWPITRIYYFRLIPQRLQKLQPTSDSFETKANRNIFTWSYTWKWISDVISFSATDVERVAGQGGVRFLRLSEKINTIMLAQTLFTPLVVALHALGGYGSKLPSVWGVTTLANVARGITFVEEMHSIIGIVVMLLAVVVIIWHGRKNKLFGLNALVETNPFALLISGINGPDRTVAAVKKYVNERAGRPLSVTQVKLVRRNKPKLKLLKAELEIMRETRQRFESSRKKTYLCVPFYNFCNRIEATVYYRNRERELQQQIEEAKRDESYSGSALVKFSNEEDTRAALRSFGKLAQWGPIIPDLLYYALDWYCRKDDNPKKWSVMFAPPKDDIDYENLVRFNPKNNRIYRFLTVVLLFLVSAVSIVAAPYVVSAMKTQVQLMGFFGETFLIPAFKFAWNTSTLLLIGSLDRLVAKSPVKSNREISVMQWVLYYMTFNDLLLNLLQITTIDKFIAWISDSYYERVNPRDRIRCIFRESLGKDMAKSMIVACFIRSVMLILRVPHHFDIRPWHARTVEEADVRHSRKSIKSDMGYRFADHLYLYFMAMTVAQNQPLVIWCAHICMLVRYWVDKHCLCNTYDKTTNADELHRKVIPLVFQPFVFQSISHLLFRFYMGEIGDWTSIAEMLAITYVGLAIFVHVSFWVYIHYWVESRRFFAKKPDEDSEL